MLLVLWIPKRMSNGFQGSGRSDSALYAVSWLLKYFNLLVISKLIYTTAAQILLLQYCLKQGDNFFSHSVQRYLYLHSQFINQKRLQFSTVKKTHNCHHANSWTIFVIIWKLTIIIWTQIGDDMANTIAIRTSVCWLLIFIYGNIPFAMHYFYLIRNHNVQC